MKVYISGKVTGLDENKVRRKFLAAEMKLKARGYEVVNPYSVNMMLPHDTTWEQYMIMSLDMLQMCDAIYLLKDWKDSTGAKMEFNNAITLGLSIISEEHEVAKEEQLEEVDEYVSDKPSDGIARRIEKAAEEMCDRYCRYSNSSEFQAMDYEDFLGKYCDHCPLSRLV